MGQEASRPSNSKQEISETDQFQPTCYQVNQTIHKIRRQYKFSRFFLKVTQPSNDYHSTVKTSLNKYSFLSKQIKLAELQDQSIQSVTASDPVINVQKQYVIQ